MIQIDVDYDKKFLREKRNLASKYHQSRAILKILKQL